MSSFAQYKWHHWASKGISEAGHQYANYHYSSSSHVIITWSSQGVVRITYEFKVYFVAWLLIVWYPTYNPTRSKTPFPNTIIEEDRCHHGDERLWPLPWPVAWWRPNQAYRRHSHTMEDDLCAWFCWNPSSARVVSAATHMGFSWLFGVCRILMAWG